MYHTNHKESGQMTISTTQNIWAVDHINRKESGQMTIPTTTNVVW
jgi:hypothetical protein